MLFLNKNDLDLLLIGESNWDYFKDKNYDSVYAIAKKGTGSKDCIFGDTKHFRNWLLKELSINDKLEAKLTSKGFSLIPEYEIK
ncbi:hypothetical protein [Oceanobacillus timonensis]|uniref:hypothetical protein n=1 Tax=Oceanobacillus timonensis TaxID=1926285 RepID=UPI0009BBDB0F|nr:hypothetical protein [Oceanobacillus timonensis]